MDLYSYALRHMEDGNWEVGLVVNDGCGPEFWNADRIEAELAVLGDPEQISDIDIAERFGALNACSIALYEHQLLLSEKGVEPFGSLIPKIETQQDVFAIADEALASGKVYDHGPELTPCGPSV